MRVRGETNKETMQEVEKYLSTVEEISHEILTKGQRWTVVQKKKTIEGLIQRFNIKAFQINISESGHKWGIPKSF